MANKEEKTLEQLKEAFEKIQKEGELMRKEIARKEAEEAERKKTILAAEKEARKTEVEDAINNAIKLLKKYTKDYGSFSITDNIDDLSFLFGSKPWRFFL